MSRAGPNPDAPSDPFEVLGIAATQDRAKVKRAYFSSLRKHPPHADPAGFQRVRAAYEALSGSGIFSGYLTAPVDFERELEADEPGVAELGESLARRVRCAASAAAQRDAFVKLLREDLQVVLGRQRDEQ